MKNLSLLILFVASTFLAFAGKTPSLKDAIMAQDFEKVKLALEQGADANEVWSSSTALYWAADVGRLDMMKLLIEKGAKVDGTAFLGNTALFGIVSNYKMPSDYVNENQKINDKILKHYTEAQCREKGWWRETNISLFSTPAERAKLLLDNGADPNFLVGNGTVKEWTPFLEAVKKAYLDLVKVMLESKKVDTEFRFHQWSEGVVSFTKHLDAGKYENSDDVRVWAKVPKFDTPLLFAVEKNNLEMVKLLVEGGAEINNGKKVEKKEWFYYKSPLDIATENGFTAIIEYLNSKGAVRYQK